MGNADSSIGAELQAKAASGVRICCFIISNLRMLFQVSVAGGASGSSLT